MSCSVPSPTITFPRYDNYRDSGIPWLGKIPTHWNLKPCMTFSGENKEKNIGMKESQVLSLSYGRIIVKPLEKLTGLVPESFETYQVISPDDIIIRTTDLQNDKTSLRTGLAKNKGIITSAYLCLRPSNSIVPAYLYYVLHAYDLLKVYYGMGSGLRQNLDYRDFKRLNVPYPDIETQNQIAAFLDEKTAGIDAAIAKKQRLIELLKEQKAILINQVVTRGLNPDAPLRDSGVPWIGKIPVHWDVKKAKYLFMEVNERSETGTEELLSVSHLTGVTPRSEKNVNMFMAEDYTGAKLCQKNDLVFNIMWAWMGALGISDRIGIVSSSYGVYRQKNIETFNAWYLENLLRSIAYVAEYNRRSTGLHSSRLRLYPDMFFAMELGYPSAQEQNNIENTMKSKTLLIDGAILVAEREIERLREYKAVLIAEAVTGKVRV